MRLLESPSHRRYALCVEAEPVHAADVPGVFDFQAAIHHDREPSLIRDACAFRIDDRELTPQAARANLHGVGGNRRQRLRRAKDVDDVDVDRDVEETVRFSDESPSPDVGELYRYLYADDFQVGRQEVRVDG